MPTERIARPQETMAHIPFLWGPRASAMLWTETKANRSPYAAAMARAWFSVVAGSTRASTSEDCHRHPGQSGLAVPYAAE